MANNINHNEIFGYRAKIFYFLTNPTKSTDSYKYHENGVLYVQNGYILDVGDYDDFFDKYQDVTYIEYLDKLPYARFYRYTCAFSAIRDNSFLWRTVTRLVI